MKTFKRKAVSLEELGSWKNNPSKNPRTGRNIKLNGPTYNYLEKEWEKVNNTEYGIDPILLTKLPIIKNKPVFLFKYKWDPYTGERTNIELDNPVCFDPDTLLHYFYTMRVNHLWISNTDDGFSGTYGEAVGKGPLFYIKGRSYHPEWHLFRLPEMDNYLPINHNRQIPVIMPLLNDKEIKELYSICKKYGDNYLKCFNRPRPNLLLIKKYYEIAIDPDPKLPCCYSSNNSDLEKDKIQYRHQAIDLLRFC